MKVQKVQRSTEPSEQASFSFNGFLQKITKDPDSISFRSPSVAKSTKVHSGKEIMNVPSRAGENGPPPNKVKAVAPFDPSHFPCFHLITSMHDSSKVAARGRGSTTPSGDRRN